MVDGRNKELEYNSLKKSNQKETNHLKRLSPNKQILALAIRCKIQRNIILQNQLLMKSILTVLFCLFFFSSTTLAQGISGDTSSINNQVKQSITLYDRFRGAEANIYNGREYVPYSFKKKGSPFFESDTLTNGWISYEGKVYQSIPMQYDVARNQVIILNYDERSKIFLQNNVIDSFHFLDHTFINLKENPEQKLNNPGFYDLLYTGHAQLLATRKRSFKETIQDNEIIRVFYTLDRFYIYKNDKYYAVYNKNDVFRLFNDKKHEIKIRMRQQNIKFGRENFEQALKMATVIYDQLMH